MTDCKHDWFFVNGTDDLKCKRCGEVTGPTPPEQLAQNMFKDIATMGSAWSQEGQRIDLLNVYKVPEYDTTQFYMPTGQLQVANFKPNYNLTFHNNHEGGTGKQVGKFDFNGPEMLFEGDAAESAKVFVDWVARSFHGRLEEERAAEREACAKMCDEFGLSHAAEAIRHRGKA